jgi:hypothetical protein
MALTQEELKRRFTYHAPTGDQPARYEAMRYGFRTLAELIDALVPDSREKSVAMTNLETAQFWSNAGIAREY